MLTICPYHPGDADQALRLFRWISELENRVMSHDLMLIADSRCSPATAQEIETAARQSFRSVQTLPFVDHYKRWPDAPNSCFAMAARHVMANQRVPWLFLEPDCCPLKAGWLDAIEAEYKTAGKPFMGARVEVNEVPLHMSGNGVYPADMFQHAGNALIAGDIAWDVAAASQIVPQAHFTKLIVHAWKHPSFNDQSEVDNMLAQHSEASLFHSDKNGSLIRLLRERKNNLPVHVQVEAVATTGSYRTCDGEARESTTTGDDPTAWKAGDSRGGQLICDLFLKSWPGDYQWLEYSLRSIQKFAQGFRRIVLVTPHGATVFPPGMGMTAPHEVKLVELPEVGDGYMVQQVRKMEAHKYTGADYILFLDSDTIFTRPVTPETYFVGDRIAWLMTPWEHTETPWRPIVEKFLGQPVEFEYMRRHPTMAPRWLLIAIGEFCQQKHGMSIEQYVMSQPNRDFTEFNCLGAFAYYFHRDKFHWINTATATELPELTVRQEYSWGGLTPEIAAEFELILSGHGEPQALSPNVDPLPAQTVCPAGSRSLEQIIEELKPLCASGAQTRRVRLALHKAGVIELPYRNRRRKGWRKKRVA